MENRSIFALHGITGMLIATVLLLVVEGTLVFLAVSVQQDVAQDYYYIEDVKTIKEITDHFAINAKKFDTDKFTKEVASKPSIAAVAD